MKEFPCQVWSAPVPQLQRKVIYEGKIQQANITATQSVPIKQKVVPEGEWLC